MVMAIPGTMGGPGSGNIREIRVERGAGVSNYVGIEEDKGFPTYTSRFLGSRANMRDQALRTRFGNALADDA